MKRNITLLSLCFVLISLLSQNIDKSYTSSVRGDETVYFIYPMKNFKNKNIKKDLEYDITYNHKEDSVTYNFTFFWWDAFSVDSIHFIGNDDNISNSVNVLFIEPQKELWKHRISVRLPYDKFKEFYQSNTPYQITLRTETDSLLFEINTKAWDKQSSTLNKIFQVIELNKK